MTCCLPQDQIQKGRQSHKPPLAGPHVGPNEIGQSGWHGLSNPTMHDLFSPNFLFESMSFFLKNLIIFILIPLLSFILFKESFKLY
jgi:hypothetical protein